MNERTSDRHINNHICGRVWNPGKSSSLKKAILSGKPLKGTSKNQQRVHHRPRELVRNAASQAPLQTHWVRIYLLKRHSGDSLAHHRLRSTLSGLLLPLYSQGETAGRGGPCKSVAGLGLQARWPPPRYKLLPPPHLQPITPPRTHLYPPAHTTFLVGLA